MLPWQKLKQSFSTLAEKLAGAFKRADSEGLEETLIEADIGVERTQELVRLSAGSKERLALLLIQALKESGKVLELSAKPSVIMLAGTNGSGKTTTVAKLAALLSSRKVLIAAADTYRDAAGAQLERWALRTSTDLVTSVLGQDAGAVVFDALSKALSKDYGVVLIDTAGRLHTRKDLMDEALKIKRVCSKVIPDAPHHVLLVMDASTGQNGLKQAEEFSKALGVTGLVVTKLDGTSKAGIVIPIVERLRVPIHYVGVGEGPEDLAPFSAEEFVRALLG
ncbi:signal recognition particle-docking protein FtsY [bacterium]|nr:signal recognition particle-docking protein FtsY [bacterium]